jgi:HEAT repeat protein
MFEQTIEQLTHTNPEMRYQAAQQLGTSQDERAVEALIAALPDANAKVQYAAFSGLVKLADKRAAAPLVALLLNDPHSRVWELLKLNIGLRLRNGLLDLVERGDSALADQLLAGLESEALDDPQRAFLVRLIGRTGDTRLVDELLDRLEWGTTTMQGAAAEALGYIGDTRAFGALLKVLQEADTGAMREISTEALGRIGDVRAYDALVEALKDEDEWVRRAAAVGLGALGDDRAVHPLVQALQDPNTMVQDAAFESIKQLSNTRYTTVL